MVNGRPSRDLLIVGVPLHAFLEAHRLEILDRCIGKIMASSPAAADRVAELTNDLPACYDALIGALRRDQGLPAGGPPPDHGKQRFRLGFDVQATVHDFGALCEAITDASMAHDQTISTREYQILNQSLDTDAERTSHLGFIAHELRNALSAAMMSFQMMRSGKVSFAGTTAGVLERSHRRLRELVDKLLVDVRLKSARLEHKRVHLATFLGEVAASIEPTAGEKKITVRLQVDDSLHIDCDRHLLFSAVANLVQNAVKFTRPGGEITVRGAHAGERTWIEVEDECGGLAPGRSERIFEPFVQTHSDRSGLGLGLAITRQAVQLHQGKVAVANHPGKGCVFKIDLPSVEPARRE